MWRRTSRSYAALVQRGDAAAYDLLDEGRELRVSNLGRRGNRDFLRDLPRGGAAHGEANFRNRKAWRYHRFAHEYFRLVP